MTSRINFLLCGVGGQGTVLASDVLVSVGLAAGYQAKQAEVHGMSQRGGSVTSFVRWGKIVHSPLVGLGEMDILLAFEKLVHTKCLEHGEHNCQPACVFGYHLSAMLTLLGKRRQVRQRNS